jgi:hypothetical protein
MNCPRCGSANLEGARFCSTCGQALGPSAIAPIVRSVPDPNTAFVLELVLGLFGFLGIGWVYAGRIPLGLTMMAGWWLVVVSGLGGSVFTGFLGCCFWLPIHFVAPFISALLIKNELEKTPRG